MTYITHRTTDGVLDALVRSAVAAGAPTSVADEARSITALRFASLRERQRVERSSVQRRSPGASARLGGTLRH